MDNIVGYTPFSEYREEQSSINIFDYFVKPTFFKQFCDKKPILIYGARGSGKTTIMKAMAISETKNIKDYIMKKDYIGIYYRVDLNVTTSFKGDFLDEEKRRKLFSHYFVLALSYELIKQVIEIKKEITCIKEGEIAEKFSLLFSHESKTRSFEELRKVIYKEMHNVRDFLNNCDLNQFPHICDYCQIINELPGDILECFEKKDKTIFYLIDEFEGLDDWQQQIVLSFAKYSNSEYTFKICMRPDGLKTSDTIGGEYISETDDVRSIDLTEKITANKSDFYNYALEVCRRRVILFYKKNNINVPENLSFEELFEEVPIDNELNIIFKNKNNDIKKEIDTFFESNLSTVGEIKNQFKKIVYNNYLDFYIFRIIYFKLKENIEKKITHVMNHDKVYNSYLENYKNAILYYLCLSMSSNKCFSGFRTMVNISGGTIRYLLEICNEVFEIAQSKGFIYNNPTKISASTQTQAIISISNKRVSQVSAIPQIGINIRTFIIALGRIFQIYHKDSRISKIETNHFSLKSDSGENNTKLQMFLKECVMRGVLIKSKNNKIKNPNSIGKDEYIYVMHPIYTPAFSISWRRKQKVEFTTDCLEVLISNNTYKITNVIKDISKNSAINDKNIQLKLPIL